MGQQPGAPSDKGRTRRLTATDWADAALTAIAEGGLAAVAVEPLAARLGATKGSFYWHFPNRRALIDAALEIWEYKDTEAIITTMEAVDGPAERLRRLLTLVVGTSLSHQIEVALLAAAADPSVGPVVRRATQRRVDYVASLYRDLGLSEADARSRALISVSIYMGHVQLAHAAPDVLPREQEEWQRHVDRIYESVRLVD
jgi:AcrR family transcriptional regulator